MMNRRAFSRCLAVAGGGLALLWRPGHRALAARKAVLAAAPTSGAEEGIEARIENEVLHIDYSLSATRTARSRVPLPQATFVTAINLSSQRPIHCGPLAGVPGLSLVGPTASKTGVRYQASVGLAALVGPGSEPVLIHVSFWQHQSAVLPFRFGA
jgi:hypothetical protein